MIGIRVAGMAITLQFIWIFFYGFKYESWPRLWIRCDCLHL